MDSRNRAGRSFSESNVPSGLAELLFEFAVAALTEKPVDIEQFAADYFVRHRSTGVRGSAAYAEYQLMTHEVAMAADQLMTHHQPSSDVKQSTTALPLYGKQRQPAMANVESASRQKKLEVNFGDDRVTRDSLNNWRENATLIKQRQMQPIMNASNQLPAGYSSDDENGMRPNLPW